MRSDSRLKRMERAIKTARRKSQLFRCKVDGKEQLLTVLDIAYAECAEDKDVEILRCAGFRFEPLRKPDYITLQEAFNGLY